MSSERDNITPEKAAFLRYIKSFHTPEYKNNYTNLFSKEFENLCKKEIIPILKEIENSKSKYFKEIKNERFKDFCKTIWGIIKSILILIAVLSLIYLTLLGTITIFPATEPIVNKIASLIVLFIILGVFASPFLLLITTIVISIYNEHFARKRKFKILKTKIFPILFSNIAECQYYSEVEEDLDKLFSYMINLSMVKKRGGLLKYFKDDRFRLIYNDLKIDICECIGSGTSAYVCGKKVFSRGGYGLFLRTKSPKKFKGKTTIRKRYSYINSDKSDDVILENKEFNEKFLVETTDQVEARYLITPIFMERLLKVSQRYPVNEFNISFEHRNINLLVFGDEDDKFEFAPPLEKIEERTAIQACRAIVIETLELISILETLKLNENS